MVSHFARQCTKQRVNGIPKRVLSEPERVRNFSADNYDLVERLRACLSGRIDRIWYSSNARTVVGLEAVTYET